jgi:hypothetical protein
VDDGWLLGIVVQREDAFQPQQLNTQTKTDAVQKVLHGRPADGLVPLKAVGADSSAIVSNVPRFLAMRALRRESLSRKPRLGICAEERRGIAMAGEQRTDLEVRCIAVDNACSRIEEAERIPQGVGVAPRNRVGEQISLREDQRIGEDCLLQAFQMRIEADLSGHHIDRRDDALQAEAYRPGLRPVIINAV